VQIKTVRWTEIYPQPEAVSIHLLCIVETSKQRFLNCNYTVGLTNQQAL